MTESTTSTTSLLERDLIRDEGWKDRPYKDTLGHLTIGVGHNLDAEGLCKEAILAQLRYDIKHAEGILDARMAGWRDLPDPAKRVLTNLAFNIGNSLFSFKQMILAVHNHDWNEAAAQLLSSLYAKQVGERAVRLANLFRSCYNSLSSKE